MKKTILFIIGIMAVTTPRLSAAAAAPDEIFTYGAGARGLGMGRAFCAAADDATAGYWNPAGLVRLRSPQAVFLHAMLWENTSYDYIGCGWPMVDNRAIGVSIVRAASSGFDRRDEFNEALGSFGVSQTGVALSFGQRVVRRALAGISFKYLTRSIDTTVSSVSGVDVGVSYAITATSLCALRMANVVSFSGGDTRDTLTPSPRLGFSKKLFDDRLLLDVDMEQSQLFFGVEMTVLPAVVRFGMNSDELCLGAGMIHKKYTIDYALAKHAELGFSHRMSLGVKFGADRMVVRAKRAAALFAKADAQILAGKCSKAVGWYQKGLALSDDDRREREYRCLRKLIEQDNIKDAGPVGGESDRAARDSAYKAVKRYCERDLKAAAREVKNALYWIPDYPAAVRLSEVMSTEDNVDMAAAMADAELVASKLQNAVRLFGEKKYEDALKELKAAERVDAGNVLILSRLGSTYFTLGLRNKALETYKKALDLDPENKQLQEFIRFLETE